MFVQIDVVVEQLPSRYRPAASLLHCVVVHVDGYPVCRAVGATEDAARTLAKRRAAGLLVNLIDAGMVSDNEDDDDNDDMVIDQRVKEEHAM